MSEWQPIESAPQTGADLLLLTKYGAIVGYWSVGAGEWQPSTDPEGDLEAYMEGISHWSPLPDPQHLPSPPEMPSPYQNIKCGDE